MHFQLLVEDSTLICRAVTRLLLQLICLLGPMILSILVFAVLMDNENQARCLFRLLIRLTQHAGKVFAPSKYCLSSI